MKLLDKLKIDENKKQSIIQFIKFGIVGVSNTAISLLVYYLFVFINKDLYLWGGLVGWIVSVLNAFYWGNRVVFKAKDNSSKAVAVRLLKSYLTYGSTFLLSELLLYIEVDMLSWSHYIAPVVNLLVTIPLNFLINKYWTFRNKEPDDAENMASNSE
ncbi:MAG: GtrA family protein [Ruminococcaceae bacterium]|nr:GtrA family protein [Oscillospiraceae bacterium]